MSHRQAGLPVVLTPPLLPTARPQCSTRSIFPVFTLLSPRPATGPSQPKAHLLLPTLTSLARTNYRRSGTSETQPGCEAKSRFELSGEHCSFGCFPFRLGCDWKKVHEALPGMRRGQVQRCRLPRSPQPRQRLFFLSWQAPSKEC